jgi:hypothetical protein
LINILIPKRQAKQNNIAAMQNADKEYLSNRLKNIHKIKSTVVVESNIRLIIFILAGLG